MVTPRDELTPLERSLLLLVAVRGAQLAGQTARIARLEEEKAELERRLARLERLVSRNSGNSSMPPSTDDQPGKTAPKRQRKPPAGGGRGKRAGGAGFGLAWSDDRDVVRVPHRPEGVCGCGADLADAADLGVADCFQQVEIPLVSARREQHEMHQARCGCGRTHIAARPAGAPGSAIGIGANLRALVVYLLVYQHVPVDRCVQLIADLTGAKVSAGFVHGMLIRCAELIGEVTHWIWTLILLAKVVGLDETPLRVGPKNTKKYVLSASTEWLTAFHLGKRDLPSFIGFGIMPWYRGVIVHDRYQLYFHRFWRVGGHQACLSHLLRDFEDAGQTYPGAIWPEQAQRALRGLIHQASLAREAGRAEIAPRLRGPLITEFRQAVVVGLHDVPRVPGAKNQVRQKPGRELLEFCRDHQDWVLAFCHDTEISPTNNLSERDLRPEKTQQKISGRLTSEDATQARLDLRGYISTARKHGIAIMDALRDAVIGTPWRPPGPAAVP